MTADRLAALLHEWNLDYTGRCDHGEGQGGCQSQAARLAAAGVTVAPQPAPEISDNQAALESLPYAVQGADLNLPHRVVVDQHGHYWRDYGDFWSMCPVSDENVETEVVAAFTLAQPAPDALPVNMDDYMAGYRQAKSDAAALAATMPPDTLRAAAQAVVDRYAHFEDCYPVGDCTCGLDALRAALEADRD